MTCSFVGSAQAFTHTDTFTMKHCNTHIWNDDSELGIQCMIHLPNSTFVTPEWVVVLRVLGVRVSCRGEDLVPGCGITVRLWHTVRRLPGENLKTRLERKLKLGFLKMLPINMCPFYLFCFGRVNLASSTSSCVLGLL